jgi:pilus assembly protein Flp/PilA
LASRHHVAGPHSRQESACTLKRLRNFLNDSSGATAIEYALISSLIAVFIIAALSALGTKLSSEFAEVGTALK